MDDWLAEAMDKENVDIPEGVTEIPDGAFKDNKNVKKITVPSTLETIGKEAFHGCARLKISPLPSSLRSIGERAFYGCTSIERFETEDGGCLRTFKGALYGSDWTLIAYPAGNREKSFEVHRDTETIEDYAFCGNPRIDTVTIGPNVSSVTGKAFLGCVRLSDIHVNRTNECFRSVDGDLYSEDARELVFMTPRPRKHFVQLRGVEVLAPYCMAECSLVDAIYFHDSLEEVSQDAFGEGCRPKKLHIDRHFCCELPFEFIGADDDGISIRGKVFRRTKDGKYEFLDILPPLEHPFEEYETESVLIYGKDTEDEPDGFRPVNVTGASFDEIAGLDEAKETIYRHMVLPAKHPDLFDRFDLEASTGMLLYGPPGTGKTMLARAVASEIDAKFYSIKSTDIRNCFVGASEENIRVLFETARKDERAVIFFDDFDSLGRTRGNRGEPWQSDLIDEILVQMQGVERHKGNLMVLAATNRPWEIDSALMRSGRFGTHVYVELPNIDAREKIIRNRISKVPHSESVDFRYIASRTDGYNGADVEEVCKTAKMRRIHLIDSGDPVKEITPEDFEYALSRVYSSVSKKDLREIENYRRTGGDPDSEEYVPENKDSVPGYS